MADAMVRSRGTTFHIGTTAATASSDTYTEIENARALEGAFGQTWSQIDKTVIKDRYKKTMKGVADAGSITLGGPVFRDSVDGGVAPGQAALKAAADDDTEPSTYNLKIVGADGTICYLKVEVMTYTEQVGSNANLNEFRSMMMLQAAPVFAAAA